MAVCATILAKYKPETYEALVYDLNNKGLAKVNNYKIKVNRRVANVENNFFKKASIPEADWLLLASMRNKFNSPFLPYGGKMSNCYEKISGSNFPNGIKKRLKHMGFGNIKNKMNGFYPVCKPALKTINEIDSLFKSGKTIVLLINTKMYKNGKFSMFSNHFVIYNGNLMVNLDKNTLSFNILTFGFKNGMNINVSPSAFKNNYFGYLSVN